MNPPDREAVGPFLIIDGMYLIFSSFYTHRHMRTLKGDPTGALYGFITRVESYLRELSPQRILVAMDSPGKTFRHGLFPAYKEKRESPPEDLVAQIPLVKEYLRLRGIPFQEESGFEADDIIAAFCKDLKGKDVHILVVSADKDLFQLVGENVSIFHPRLKVALDATGIRDHFGLPPEQVVDYLSLAGDSSDNIPGIPGIGDKSARSLLEQFGNVDELLKNLDKLPAGQSRKISGNLDALTLSHRLVDLSGTPGLPPITLPPPFVDRADPALADFYAGLSFTSLLKSLGKEKEHDSLDIPVHVVTDREALSQVADTIQKSGSMAIDVETTGLEWFQSDLVGISLVLEDQGFYIPFMSMDSDTLSIEDFRNGMGEILANPDIKKTGHNLKFDMLHLRSAGMRVRGVEDDTMIMSYLLFPNRRSHKLKELSAEFLDFRQVTFEELVGSGRTRVSIHEVSVDKVATYCVADSHLSLRLAAALRPRLESSGLMKLYREIEIPLAYALEEMEFTGVRVDPDFLGSAATEMEKRIVTIAEEIFTMAGIHFNLNSSQQLGELLFEKMNLPVVKRTRKTRSYSTDNEVLKELRGFPIVSLILEYRTLKKLLSTYLRGLLDSLDQDNRVHSSFNQTITATGRLSSSGPNLQNIPVGEMGGISVRRAFTGEPGARLLAADYSQIELRVMAHFSEDPGMVQAFTQGADIHEYTAGLVFGKESELDIHERRRRAKIINFSILYGSGPYSLSHELGVGFAEAKRFIDHYFDTFAGVRKFIDETIQQTESDPDPQVTTLLGRHRPIPEITSANRNVRENGRRMAINTIIQGSAADIIKIAMIRIHARMGEFSARMIMQVHDELIFEYPPEEEARLIDLVRREMEGATQLRVPLEVTIKTGLSWGDLQPVP